MSWKDDTCDPWIDVLGDILLELVWAAVETAFGLVFP
jgi:hypothetical protein